MAEAQVSKSLPPIGNLFKEAWTTFKGSALNLFLLYLISFGVFAGIAIVGVIAAIPLGAFSIFSAIQEKTLTPAFFTSLGALGVIFLILIIIMIIVSLALNAAMIMVVANYKSKPSVGASFKKGFKYVLPFFVASILTGFLIYGGFFLFVIPGIVFGIAFSFVFYEIILNNKSVLAAMRRSMGIVFANFWGILGRMLLLMIVIFAVMFIPQIISGMSNDATIAGIFGLLSFVLQLLAGWFGVAYSLTLYRQAEAAAPDTKTGKLLLPTILAIVGWIIGIVLIITIVSAVSMLIQNVMLQQQQTPNAFEQLQNPALKEAIENPTEENMRALLELLPSGSPERAELEKAIEEQFNGTNSGVQNTDDYFMPTGTQN